MSGILEFPQLGKWRRPDLEELISGGRDEAHGNIAGDVIINGRSIRFSIEQNDIYPYVALSAEGHARCNRSDIRGFMALAGLVAISEVSSPKDQPVRTFKIARRQ